MLADRVKTVLREKKIKVKDVARAAGIKKARLKKMIKRNDIKLPVLDKIAAYLEVPVSYLLDGGHNTSSATLAARYTYVHISANGKNINQNAGLEYCFSQLQAAQKQNELLEKLVLTQEQLIAALQRVQQRDNNVENTA